MVGNLFKQQKIPKQAPAPTPPGVADPQARADADNATNAYAMSYGRGSTVMTSGQGDASAPDLQKLTLLGGSG